MDQALDFLSYKKLLRYLALFAIVLLGGFVAKDAFAILVVCAILFYTLKQDCFKAVELWLVWFFAYGFYTSQAFITNEVVAKYIAKPPFLLFILFACFFNRIPQNKKNGRFVFAWLLFLATSLISVVYHGQIPFVLVTVSSFFFIYLLMSERNFSKAHCARLLNLFIAVALLQTIVCILQVTQLVAAPTKMMDDGSGGQFEWIAGLDDVASGTFGAASSAVVSWYASLIALFCIVTWAVCKKGKYLLMALLSLAEFATVDSKTIMAVMVLMMVYMLFYFNKNKSVFALNIRKLVTIIVIAAVAGYGLFLGLGVYYKYQSEVKAGASSRGDISTVYQDEIKKSEDLVMANIVDWGKVQGFRYVTEDFANEGVMETLFGYGLLGYTYNGKMQFIESKDTRLMQLNNFTRSRSSLITQYAQSGLIGFILFIVMMWLWAKYNVRTEGSEEIDLVTKSLIKIFLPFTLITAFVYSISITTIVAIAFAALIAVLRKYSELVFVEEEEYQEEEELIDEEHLEEASYAV